MEDNEAYVLDLVNRSARLERIEAAARAVLREWALVNHTLTGLRIPLLAFADAIAALRKAVEG